MAVLSPCWSVCLKFYLRIICQASTVSVNEGVGYLQEKKNETKKIQQPHDGDKTTLLPEWNLQAVNSMHPTA